MMDRMKVELREIDETNRSECLALQVAPDQRAYIAGNAASLESAEELPEIARPFAIYADGEMVGFAMLAFDGADEEGEHYWLWRFMVDVARQGRGCGSAALKEILRYFRENGADMVTLSTKPDNTRALGLYHKFGFRETGRMNGEEAVLHLTL